MFLTEVLKMSRVDMTNATVINRSGLNCHTHRNPRTHGISIVTINYPFTFISFTSWSLMILQKSSATTNRGIK